MSESVPNSTQEFWRPPILAVTLPSGAAEVCADCGMEFMVGAKFCHACGARRGPFDSGTKSWLGSLGFLKVLELHTLKDRLGLPVASLIAFFSGLGCILAAIAVGLVYSAEHVEDFEAIHLWRIEWLLAAVVAFVAGILLKKS